MVTTKTPLVDCVAIYDEQQLIGVYDVANAWMARTIASDCGSKATYVEVCGTCEAWTW